MKKDSHHSWDRANGETTKAFYAFAFYRDMIAKDRSLREVARMLNASITVIAAWSTQFNWVERSKAWDDYQDQKRQETRLKVITDTAKRQARQTMTYVTSMEQIALEFVRRLKTKPDMLQKFKDNEIIDYLMNGSKALPKLQEAERIALGINPAFNVNLNVDLSQASDDELEQLATGKFK
ncbi:hypothetical protein EG832_03545 [bacterium]|nr:hypothetical protein [bacterium]